MQPRGPGGPLPASPVQDHTGSHTHAEHHSHDHTIATLHHLFREKDQQHRNDDGGLKDKLEEAFKGMDKNKDGKITIVEFRQGINAMGMGGDADVTAATEGEARLTDDQIDQVFSKFDADGND